MMINFARTQFVIFLTIIGFNAFSLSKWGDWELLYKDNDVKVEIQFKLSSNACDANGKQHKYRYNVTGNLKYSSFYVNWKIKYKDCNGGYFYQAHSVNIGNGGSLGHIESMDYMFTCSKIVDAHYDVVAEPTSREENGQLTVSEAPKSISGNLFPFAGDSTTLKVEGGALGVGAEWVWYKNKAGVTKIGTGATITVSAIKNTTYFVRAEDGSDTTSYAQCTVSVKSKTPDYISGNTAVCKGDVDTLSIVGGGLAEGAKWVWYENTCGGKKIGTGNTIYVRPTVNAEYFVRAEAANGGYTDCAQLKVNIVTKEQKQKELEAKRIAQEQIRRAAEQKLYNFLKERATRVFKYSEENKSGYSILKDEVRQALINAAATYPTVSFVGTAGFLVDTLQKTNLSFSSKKSSPTNIRDSVKFYLSKINLIPVFRNNYTLNAKDDFELSLSKTSEEYSIKKISNTELKLRKGNASSFLAVQNEILSQVNYQAQLPAGSRFTVLSNEIKTMDTTTINLKYLSYKGNGEQISTLYSLAIPGLGNHFVNENKRKPYWLITTLGVASLIGGGILSKYYSNDNYQKYLNATNQNEMDELFKKSNMQNENAVNYLFIGACWWAFDLIGVYSKGSRNEKINNAIRKNLNIQ